MWRPPRRRYQGSSGCTGRSRADRRGEQSGGWGEQGRGRRRTRQLSEKRARLGLLLLSPSLLGVLLFYGIPLVDVARRSFCDAMGKRPVGLSNFRQLLENQAFRLALRNTVRYELVCLPLLLVLSLLLALLVRKLEEPLAFVRRGIPKNDRRHVSCTALVLPLALPTASMVLVWQVFLCRQGILDQILSRATGSLWERDWMDGPWAFGVLVALYLWKNTGYDMLLWLSGLSAVPKQLYEAARIDGAGALERFWYITMPCLEGTAKLVFMLSLAGSFQVFREAFLLAGSYPNESIYLLQHLFNHWFVEMDVQKMCTAAFLMVTVGAAVWQAACVVCQGRRCGRPSAGSVGEGPGRAGSSRGPADGKRV